MDTGHLEKKELKRAEQRAKKRHPKVVMHGKRIREIPKIWKRRNEKEERKG